MTVDQNKASDGYSWIRNLDVTVLKYLKQSESVQELISHVEKFGYKVTNRETFKRVYWNKKD